MALFIDRGGWTETDRIRNDKDGSITQTASLYRVTNHVGLLQSRCVLTKKCTPTELIASNALEKIKGNSDRAQAVHANEKLKKFPSRFPMNEDSIGIEIVGASSKVVKPKGRVEDIYEPVNDQQNASLAWLVQQLVERFGVPMQEIYRHPQIGRKTPTEASTAKW